MPGGAEVALDNPDLLCRKDVEQIRLCPLASVKTAPPAFGPAMLAIEAVALLLVRAWYSMLALVSVRVLLVLVALSVLLMVLDTRHAERGTRHSPHCCPPSVLLPVVQQYVE